MLTCITVFAVALVGIDVFTCFINLKSFLPLDHARITTPSVSYDVLNETDQLILHCIATGIPAPVISWTKEQQSFVIPSNNTDPVKDSNGVYTVESILELSSVVYADRGTYICSAVGFGGVDNQTTISYFVEVQSKFAYLPFKFCILDCYCIPESEAMTCILCFFCSFSNHICTA